MVFTTGNSDVKVFNEVSCSSATASNIYFDEFSVISDIPGIHFKLPNDFENVESKPITEFIDACVYG